MSKGLPYGDYNADGDDTYIERKSVADLFGSFTGQRYEREKAKWTRCKEAGHRYILAIEASASEVRKGHSYWADGAVRESAKNGLAQIRQIMTISRKYNVPVWWCESRKDMAFSIVEYFLAGRRIKEKGDVVLG